MHLLLAGRIAVVAMPVMIVYRSSLDFHLTINIRRSFGTIRSNNFVRSIEETFPLVWIKPLFYRPKIDAAWQSIFGAVTHGHRTF
jgi:hypothetical protein